jgi:hypothetical protein
MEIERQAEDPGSRRVVQAKPNRNALVQHRRDRVHGYHVITLENVINVVSVGLGDGEKPYLDLVPTNTYCSVVFITWRSERKDGQNWVNFQGNFTFPAYISPRRVFDQRERPAKNEKTVDQANRSWVQISSCLFLRFSLPLVDPCR